jgi:hypothetical protein
MPTKTARQIQKEFNVAMDEYDRLIEEAERLIAEIYRIEYPQARYEIAVRF